MGKSETGTRERRQRLSGMSGPPMRRWPAWIVPALAGVGLTCALIAVLYFYFGPRPSDIAGLNPDFTASEKPLTLQIGGVDFVIPSNYSRIPAERRNGETEEISLHAALPYLAPYSSGNADAFEDVSVTSPVVHILLRHSDATIPTAQRLTDIYSLNDRTPDNTQASVGLKHYRLEEEPEFRDLFVGEDTTGDTIILRCSQNDPAGLPGTCLRTVLLQPGLAMTYRFRRDRLDDWRTIDEKVFGLVRGFETNAQSESLN